MNLDTILLPHLTCPITHMIFRRPVTLNDGITYECDAIQEWLKTNSYSPVNKTIRLEKSTTINLYLKNLIDSLEQHKCFDSSLRYRIHFNYDVFSKISNIEQQKKYLDDCDDLECESKECESKDEKWRPIHFI